MSDRTSNPPAARCPLAPASPDDPLAGLCRGAECAWWVPAMAYPGIGFEGCAISSAAAGIAYVGAVLRGEARAAGSEATNAPREGQRR